MPDAPTLLMFLATAVGLAVLPGPGILYVAARTLAGGEGLVAEPAPDAAAMAALVAASGKERALRGGYGAEAAGPQLQPPP